MNDQPEHVVARKLITTCSGSERRETIALLELTFQPMTDAMCEAPSPAVEAFRCCGIDLGRMAWGGAA